MPTGRLRIYLGAAPGVGKTMAMLGEGHRRRERGTDVVVGVVETHGRQRTRESIGDIEVVPPRLIDHRGSSYGEMDLDAVLARRPAVALVDELAHTNVPGSRNTKRWQDVQELLDAGIDVVSTVNIQHLESLNDVVEGITGIRQQETVPDAVVRAAEQIELVDMAPEALRRRLAHGNVYAAEKVDAALANYFRLGNLTALRELALLWVADRVDEGLARYRAEQGIDSTWHARDRIVVALTGGPEGETLLRRAALIAGRTAGRDLVALHVVRGDGTAGTSPDSIARLRTLTEDLGGSFHTVVGDDVAAALLEFARSMNGTQVVVGASRRSRLEMAVSPSTSERVVRDSGDIDVHVVTHERVGGRRVALRAQRRRFAARRRVLSWVVALLLPAALSLALLPLRDSVSLTTVVLAFLLGVVTSSLVGGVLPAVATAVLASLLANYYFTPPYDTFTIARGENAFALAVFVAVACVVAVIVDRAATLASLASKRRAEADVLASLSAGLVRRSDGVRGLLELARETFGQQAATLFERRGAPARDPWHAIEVVGPEPPLDPDHADAVVDAGEGLLLGMRGRPLSGDDRRLLGAFAAQATAVLEHDRLAVRAADVRRLEQTDRVRTAVLAAVSHDLRTPLAGIKASVSTLADSSLHLDEHDRTALLDAAADETERLDALLANLLDLSRLQTGVVAPVLEPASVDGIVAGALRGVDAERVRDETPEDLPLVLTDAGLLERVLANVVENAVRHAPPTVPVRLCAGVVDTAGTRRLEVRVVDRGPGVPDAERDRMFEPFQRLGDVPEGSGIGLGLAVARGLADAVGATLEADDTPGGGLTMVLSLPLAAPGSADGTAAEPVEAVLPAVW